MADTASKRDEALSIARFLEDHMGGETKVLDLAGRSSWTDFFVITTVHSNMHLKGLVRQLNDYLIKEGIELRRHHRQTEEAGWIILDCNEIVIHLMDAERRAFYDLENLWFQAESLSYSSKSS
jgi:ribosome-associated protein